MFTVQNEVADFLTLSHGISVYSHWFSWKSYFFFCKILKFPQVRESGTKKRCLFSSSHKSGILLWERGKFSSFPIPSPRYEIPWPVIFNLIEIFSSSKEISSPIPYARFSIPSSVICKLVGMLFKLIYLHLLIRVKMKIKSF